MRGPGLTIGSLFSGIGGLELGLEWAGLGPTLFQVERDPPCLHWLAQHWPDAERFDDVRTVGAHNLPWVDVLCGGFPCQPHSVAGKRGGSEDDRDLWPEYARLIRELRPRYIGSENVPGLLTSDDGRFFNRVLSDLAALGYDAEWGVLSAEGVGAPQLRERLIVVAWDVADAGRRGVQRLRLAGCDAGAPGPDGGEVRERERVRTDAGTGGSLVGDADRGRREQRDARVGLDSESRAGRSDAGDTASARRCGDRSGSGRAIRNDARRSQPERRSGEVGNASRAGREEHDAPAEPGRPRHAAGECARVDWSDAVPVRGFDGTIRLIPREAAEAGPQSPLWPVAPGLPGRVARLRAIGNAVVPQVAEVVGQVILALEAERLAHSA